MTAEYKVTETSFNFLFSFVNHGKHRAILNTFKYVIVKFVYIVWTNNQME